MIAPTFTVCAHGDHAIVERDLGFAAGIEFIGIRLAFRVDTLVYRDVDLSVFGWPHIDRSTRAVNTQTGTRREALLQLVVIAVRVSKQLEIAIPNIDLVANFSPVDAGSLRGR